MRSNAPKEIQSEKSPMHEGQKPKCGKFSVRVFEFCGRRGCPCSRGRAGGLAVTKRWGGFPMRSEEKIG
jgi:hypothetical protein